MTKEEMFLNAKLSVGRHIALFYGAWGSFRKCIVEVSLENKITFIPEPSRFDTQGIGWYVVDGDDLHLCGELVDDGWKNPVIMKMFDGEPTVRFILSNGNFWKEQST